MSLVGIAPIKDEKKPEGWMNMEVNAVSAGVSTVNNYTAATTTANEKTDTSTANSTPNAAAEAEGTQQNEAAVYESSKKNNKTYTPDMDKVKQMMAESDRQIASFRRLVEGLFNKQAGKSEDAFSFLKGKGPHSENMVEIDDETRAAALKEVEEGGYYSVDETAKRILDFAVALSGGDPSKLSTLKDAVVAGFKEAENAWGGKLPEISQKTYEAVMKGFDEWEEAGSSDAITLLNKTANATATGAVTAS